MAETTAARLERLEAIFADAVERPAIDRPALLDEACGGDAALRREVERLLAADECHAGLLDEAPWERHSDAPSHAHDAIDPVARPGAHIGRYRLLEQISTGGMGTVWLAERADRQFEQRVAVKLIKRGMDTEDILRRFKTERQVLAGLQHPNIGRLLDGGAVEDGRPYLVMEYIDGLPIDEYCRTHALAVEARVELFIKVCDAVQVAHRNLVVHRDLKPSNILVTAQGEPKLLDFGIAKLLSGDNVAVTATRMRVMTPLYASPEQVSGDRITTASDVYSLGVVLYELLADRRPYDLDTKAPSEIERAVLHQEPRRPSAAIGSRTLGTDLDTIVLKAMNKVPEMRYGSPEQLADDLRRHIAGRPILARPTGIATRVVKALRRNRRSVAAAIGAGIVTLLGAIAVTTYLFVVPGWAREHVQAARLELMHPDQNSAIYVAVWAMDPGAGIVRSPQSLRRAVEHYDAALRLQPLRDDIRLERDVVRTALGETGLIDLERLDDRSRGLLTALTGEIEAAFDAWSKLDLVAVPDALVEGLLGIRFLALDQPARAYPLLRSAYRQLPKRGFLCVSLAAAAARCGDWETAQALIDRARRLPGHDGTDGLGRVEADVLAAAGRYEEATAAYQRVIVGNPVAWVHYADMLEELGRPRDALAVLAQGIGRVVTWHKVNRIFIERVDGWWAGLPEPGRQQLLAEGRADDPFDERSISAFMHAYRIATLGLEAAGHPNPGAAPRTTFARRAEAIPVVQLKAWAGVVSGAVEEPLAGRIRVDLAGPDRSLAESTRLDFAAWERDWRAKVKPGDIHYRFSFAPGMETESP